MRKRAPSQKKGTRFCSETTRVYPILSIFQKSLFHGVPYEIAAFHKWDKINLFFEILPRAIGGFNHRQTAMYRGRRSVLPTNRIGNISTSDSPIIIQPQDCNGPGKNKADVRHIASQFLPVSVQALLQPSLTFCTKELHHQLPQRHSRQQSGTGAGIVGTVEIDP